MLGVFDATRGWIPLSSIARAKPSTNKHNIEVSNFILTDGTEVKAFGPVWEAFWRLPVQLIPAEANWQLCHIWAGEGAGVGLTPVIAWAMCVDGEMRPVTPCGVNDGLSDPDIGIYVRTPSGQIQPASSWGDAGTFDSPEELLAYYVPRQETQEANNAGA